MRGRVPAVLAAVLLVVAPVSAAQAGPSPAKRSPAADTSKRKCHPNYKGKCLKMNVGDYDCAGGSGNGPNYVTGPVRVVGADPFRLDANHDGVGCES
jgi:hypothetical protein